MISNPQKPQFNPEIKYRIAQSSDLESLYSFAEQAYKLKLQKESKAEALPLDDMDFMMKVWESRFRKEALEHYLKMGWSFVAERGDSSSQKIVGFFIGQPLLFFQGQTQTLWVEEAMESESGVLKELLDVAYRLARDKHFQRVIFPESMKETVELLGSKIQKLEEVIWLKTTK